MQLGFKLCVNFLEIKLKIFAIVSAPVNQYAHAQVKLGFRHNVLYLFIQSKALLQIFSEYEKIASMRKESAKIKMPLVD